MPHCLTTTPSATRLLSCNGSEALWPFNSASDAQVLNYAETFFQAGSIFNEIQSFSSRVIFGIEEESNEVQLLSLSMFLRYFSVSFSFLFFFFYKKNLYFLLSNITYY